ncbi:MAG: hypothetical protein CL677_04055 [Bdellovibrionaceae bacterium]|nr:hypothetical protein [Pseudobdellovibrionaceae bacterium]|tara:strand:- start:58731 stop:59249 length:519 start_codon:yes stop_codon:yes gene_type:complete
MKNLFMGWCVAAVAAFTFTNEAKAFKGTNSAWKPVKFFKVSINNKAQEDVVLTQFKRGKNAVSYAASYYINDKQMGHRVLPKSVYMQLRKRFPASSPNKSTRVKGLMGCATGGYTVSEGIYDKNAKAKAQSSELVCLKASASLKERKSYSQWFRGMTSLFKFKTMKRRVAKK